MDLRTRAARMIWELHRGGCQNHGPFLGTLKIRCRITIGIRKGTIISTTTHIGNRPETLTVVRIYGPGFVN